MAAKYVWWGIEYPFDPTEYDKCIDSDEKLFRALKKYLSKQFLHFENLVFNHVVVFVEYIRLWSGVLTITYHHIFGGDMAFSHFRKRMNCILFTYFGVEKVRWIQI
jgi:hypothetical protein